MSRVDPHDTQGKCNTSSCEGVYFALGHIVPTWFSGYTRNPKFRLVTIQEVISEYAKFRRQPLNSQMGNGFETRKC